MAQWLVSQRKLSVGRMGKSLGLNQRVSPRTWIEGRQRSDRANEPLGDQEADLGLMEGVHLNAQGRPQSVPYAPTPTVDQRMTELRRSIKEALTRTCERAAVLTIVPNITSSMDCMVERILKGNKLRTLSPFGG